MRRFCSTFPWHGILAIVVHQVALTAALADDPFEPLLKAPPVHWGTPMADGPLDAWFILGDSAAEEIEGLLARFDVEARAFLYRTQKNRVRFDPIDARRDLQGKPDIVVVAGVSFDELPEDLRKAAAEAVTAGSGYFQIAHGPALRHTLPAFLAADAQQLGSPDFGSPSRDRWLTDFDRRLDALRTYRTPAGRVVTLVWPADLWGNGGLLPRARADALNAPPSVEDYYAIIGEALRWAANRDAPVRIVEVRERTPEGPDAVSTPPQLPQRFVERMGESTMPGVIRRFELRLDEPAPESYDVRVQVRHPFRRVRWEYALDEKLRKGSVALTIDLPIGIGPSYVDIWLDRRGEIALWHTAAFDISGWPKLSDIELPPFAVDANDRLASTFVVEPDLARSHAAGLSPRPTQIVARGIDPHGRIVGEEHLRVSGKGAPARIEMPLVDLLSPYLRFELYATPFLDAPLTWWVQERSAYAAAHVVVRRPPRNALTIASDLPGDGSHRARVNRMRARGEGVHLAHAGVDRAAWGTIAADGLRPMGSFRRNQADACASPSALTRNETDRLQRIARELTPLRPERFVVFLDANLCADAIGDALRNRFHSLDAFNATRPDPAPSWDAAARQVAFDPSADAMALRSILLAETALRLKASVDAALHPTLDDVRVAVVTPDDRANYLLAARDAGASIADLAHPSAALVHPPNGDASHGPVLGTHVPPDAFVDTWAGWIPWYAAIHGYDTLWLMRNRDEPYPLDRLRARGAVSPFAESIDRLGSGYDRLLRASTPMRGEVLVVLSEYDLLDPGHDTDRVAGWHETLTALGLTVDVTLAENLSPGELNAYHLAIVPSASTLPPELDPHLTKFAKQGGVVYSDRSMAWSSEVFDAPARAGGSSRDARNRLAAALNEAGIPPDREGEVDVSASYRGPYLRRTLGLAELHVFLHRFDADETARIAFQSSRGRHLYAPLHEPGHVENRKRIELAPGQAGMVCTLPYEVSRIAIETAPHAAAGSRLRYALAVRTIGALPGDHVVAVALFDPEGKELKHYRQSHVANAGRAQGYIPLTVNDVPGEYTLRVVDALTGVASETTVEVR